MVRTMKITGPSAPGLSSGSAARSRPADGFRLTPGGPEATARAASAQAASSIGSVDALLALQAVDEVGERRRRALRRGSVLLDQLDALKLALVSGQPTAAALGRLGQAVAQARDTVDDAGLTEVLDHIETRAAVELAKAAMARTA